MEDRDKKHFEKEVKLMSKILFGLGNDLSALRKQSRKHKRGSKERATIDILIKTKRVEKKSINNILNALETYLQNNKK